MTDVSRLPHEPIRPVVLAPTTVTALAPGQVLESAEITRTSLNQVDALGISLDGVRLSGVELSSGRLKKASLTDVEANDCLFFGTNLDGSGWLRVRINGGVHSGLVVADCSFQEVMFVNAKLNLANFRMSKLKHVTFRGCNLAQADFQGAELAQVRFVDCDLDQAEFSNVHCKQVDLRGSIIATVKGVSALKGVTVSSAQLISIAGTLAAEAGIVVAD